jgi:hypothetical protein
MAGEMQHNCYTSDSFSSLDVDHLAATSYVFEMASPIGELMKILMAEKRVKIRDLADATGLTRVSVWRHVRGEIEPDMATRKIYAEVFMLTFVEFERRWQEIEQLASAQSKRAAKKGSR